MPKILINEFNKPTSGTPGRYANYAVLLTGYMGTPDTTKGGDVLQPDANGVYEFSSESDFIATIGEAEVEKKNALGEVVELHYGNRMAHHLLKMGYPIIYKVIDRISEMNNQNFWAIFKDKASYDFRFVSHGLCESCYDVAEHTDLYDKLESLKEDVARFQKILADVAEAREKNPNTELTNEIEYNRVITTKDAICLDDDGEPIEVDTKQIFGEGHDGFKNDSEQYYSYATAETLFKLPAGGGKAKAITDHEAKIAEHDDQHVSPEVFNNINGYIAKLASYRTDGTGNDGRGDCIALIELDEDAYFQTNSTNRPEQLIITGINNKLKPSIGDEGKYCAMTVPSVWCWTGGKEPIKFPGAFYYLACFINSINSGFAEWYAAAGYTRGVANYPIYKTSVKLGEIAINALEPRTKETSGPDFACNVIANFRGSYYLWGNRTAAKLELGEDLTADHFLNIRQLCTTIKKQLYVACRRFTFDPNSDTLWFNFVNAITPTLDAMKADQGIRDYKVLKVVADKKATMKAKIRIIPIEAVEDFELEIYLEDSFGETLAVVND